MRTADDAYERAAGASSRALTLAYSTSFSLGIRMFARHVRQPVFDVYGLVRLADEIVDTWDRLDQAEALAGLEREVGDAVRTGFSLNPVVHAYARTARRFGFEPAWTAAFFASMRADLKPDPVVTADDLDRYVYGSAEVIGLMCLAVFVPREPGSDGFERLAPGARALGSAFQRINFLRDISADLALGRTYFPSVREHGVTDATKAGIIASIRTEIAAARLAVRRLPVSSRYGVSLALRYYDDLLDRLERSPARTLMTRRVRISNGRKAFLLAVQLVSRG